MPNYSYRCNKCDRKTVVVLPISFDPDKLLNCQMYDGGGDCDGLMRRTLEIVSNFSMGNGGTLGKWYRDKTGKELLG